MLLASKTAFGDRNLLENLATFIKIKPKSGFKHNF
jgi:hypothetical protein